MMALARRIFTLGNRPGFKWQHIVQAQVMKKEGDPVHPDAAAETAFVTAGSVYNYFLATFGRDSYNNGGRKTDVYLHRGVKSKEAQFYHTPEQDLVTMGDGDGKNFNSPLASPDVLAHEMGHGYLQYLATLKYGYSEAGAIIEHVADVFAWLVRQSTPGAVPSWAIAAGYPKGKRALRDLLNPADPTLAIPCAQHAGQLRKIKSQADLYFNGGVLGRAFAECVEEMGHARADEAGKIWYLAVQRLPAQGSIKAFRDEIYEVVTEQFPDWDAAVHKAFGVVGL
jgi:Zn-dependent metalloprotease